jgi:hypothetical protein
VKNWTDTTRLIVIGGESRNTGIIFSVLTADSVTGLEMEVAGGREGKCVDLGKGLPSTTTFYKRIQQIKGYA